MAHHAQCLRGVAGDQHTLALGQQVPDKISDGVRFSRARRALHQDASMLLKLLGNSDLLRICGFAQQHLALCVGKILRQWIRTRYTGNRRFFSNDIQQ